MESLASFKKLVDSDQQNVRKINMVTGSLMYCLLCYDNLDYKHQKKNNRFARILQELLLLNC